MKFQTGLQNSGKGSGVDGKARSNGEEWKQTKSPLTHSKFSCMVSNAPDGISTSKYGM